MDESQPIHERHFEADFEVRDASARELLVRLVPWGVVANSKAGPEVWESGAFDDVDPTSLVLQLEHMDPPAGRSRELENRSDGQYAVFRVSKTQRGDDILALAMDGVTRGVSVTFADLPGGTEIQTRNGRRTRVVRKADVRAVSTTWRPTWQQSAVLEVRSEPEQEIAPMTEEIAPIVVAAPVDLSPLTAQITAMQTDFSDRFAALEERSRGAQIIIPTAETVREPKLYEWADAVVRLMSGERLSPAYLHERALDDVLVADNPGLVPHAFSNTVIGIMDTRRQFLNTTTQIPAPPSGMTLTIPRLTQRATADVQLTEKTEIESTALKSVLASFDALTIAAGADVSIQMIKRSSPGTMDLLMRDMARAYGAKADQKAIAALLAAGTTPGAHNIDPEALLIGDAWGNSIANYGEPPDTLWLSSAAVEAFIDAKDNGTNRPLYSNLTASIAAGNLPGGGVSALRPVYCPALDGTTVDVMVGPSSGFVWAEDGAFELAVDNPTLAGRDIAIVGIMFFVPRYPLAFTTYDIGS